MIIKLLHESIFFHDPEILINFIHPKLAGYKEHNGTRFDNIPESNGGVALPATSASPLDREQRQGVLEILRVRDEILPLDGDCRYLNFVSNV